VLHPITLKVSVLEPWEREVLELCDGVRAVHTIAALVAADLGGTESAVTLVQRCLRFLHDEGLLTSEGSPAKPRDALTDAFLEWHREPAPRDTTLPPSPFANDEIRSDPRMLDDDTAIRDRIMSQRDDETVPAFEHIAPPVRDIFDRLRRAAFKVRGYLDSDFGRTPTGSHPRRRHDDEGAVLFDEALAQLTAGEIDRARAGFASLMVRFPKSRRLMGIVEAIDSSTTSTGNE